MLKFKDYRENFNCINLSPLAKKKILEIDAFMSYKVVLTQSI